MDETRVDIYGNPITSVPEIRPRISNMGHPTQSEYAYQKRARELIQSCVTEEHVLQLGTMMLTKALEGDEFAIRWITDRVFGQPNIKQLGQEGDVTINVFKFPDWVGQEAPWERAPAAQASIEGAPHRVIDAPAQEPE